MVTNQKVNPMNAKETKAKMDRWVEVRKLLAKLDREIFGVRTTLKELEIAVDYENSYSCSVELTEEEADGFHGKSYSDYEESLKWKNALCAEKNLNVHIRQLKYGTVKMVVLTPSVYGTLLNCWYTGSNHGW